MTDTTVTTEAPRNDAGQFASAEPAYGREGLERAAGYVPMKDESKEEVPEELTKDEAAARLKELSGPESAIITHTTGLEPHETMTIDQAAKMLAESRDADAAQAEIDGKKAEKAEQAKIDKLRGEKPAEPKFDTEQDIEKALANPKIREAISAKVTEAETQREAYATRVAETGKIAVATLAADFPELANSPLQNWEHVLRQMHAREPARFQQAMGRIQAVAQLEQAHNSLKAEKSGREAAEFRAYAQAEDARFTEMVKGERNMPAIEAEIVAMVKDHGVDPREFFQAGTESKFLRSAAAQKILVDAAKYRMMQKVAKATPTRVVPTVQAPGYSGPRTNRADASLAALSAKLNQSGNLKDAARLLAARRSNSKGR